MNHNRRSMMGLTSHISFTSDVFSYYRVYFASVKNLKMMGLGPVFLVRLFFRFALAIILVVSVA